LIVWRQSGGGWRIVSDSIDLDHEAFRSSTSLEVTLPAGGGAPDLDLHTHLSDVDVAGLRALIPEPVLKPDVRGWLDNALVGGTVPVANVTWSGAIDKFPFDSGEGEFRAIAELSDVELAYAKNWPVARGIDGTLSFRNASFVAGLNSGELAGNRVSLASVSMIDLREGELKLELSAEGMLDKVHGYLLATPLIKDDDDTLRTAEFAGAGITEVDITMPLKHRVDTDVAVTISTEAGEVALQGLSHRLEQVEGSLNYRNGDFSANGITALVLGAPVIIDVAPHVLNTDEGPRRATVATGRGVVTDQELTRLHDSLSSMLAGSAAYTATVTFPEKAAAMPVSVEIVSRLDGMAVTLPEPITKNAATPENFALTMFLPRGGVQTDVFYGDVGNARINWLRDSGTDWMLDRGGVHLGTTPAVLPESAGLAISGAADKVHLGGWLGLNTQQDSSQSGPVTSVRLDVGELDAYGQKIADATVSVDRSEREWLVQIDSPMVAGGMFVPYARDPQPIIANMERLYIDTGDDTAGAVPGDSELDPANVPEIDLQADDFRLGDMKLGAVNARIRKTVGGVALEEFAGEAAAFTVSGNGVWRLDQDGHNSRLDLKLISTDLAPTLADLGFDESIDASNAEIDFALNWPGPPGPQFKSELDGTVKVRVGAGQLQSVQPGAGRVFGLLSFTALPRRLSLDFRDVFDKGF
ncbi:MAG: DUF3971 domain-containing protein, partial [Gammaproteobacteria bacterium]|nr:DUF3971 domain-containing protein [Gammaproteobacteria bacterium]